jgi:predicted dehydrogenase
MRLSPLQTPARTMTRQTPLRLGILGCANIARQFVRDVAPSKAVRIVAVASRSAATAATFAAEFAIPRHHGRYEDLLADPGVDAVYVPLPNSLHASWAIEAARQGKHVLCEKPLALGLDEAREMFAVARQHKVMLLEAYPWWFQPQTGELVRLLQSSAIGRVLSVQASFGFMLGEAPGNIRLNPALGGGALLDLGSYVVSLTRLAMGSAPQRVHADVTWDASGVDLATSATLHYADGRRSQLACAMDVAAHRHALIVGSDGAIETEFLNHTGAPGGAFGYQPSQMRVRRGARPFETVLSPAGSGFRFAAEAFAKVVAEEDFAAIERAAAVSLDIAATLDALDASARSGEPVALEHV